MEMNIRPAEQRDAAAVVEVARQSIRELCLADHRGDRETLAQWLANKTPENFLAWLANPDNFCVVADLDDQVSGVGLVHRSGEIRLFFLAPGAQRLGVGKAIHAKLEAAAKRWGLSSLHPESTAMARPFYEAVGYRSTGPAIPRFGVLCCFPYEKRLRSEPTPPPSDLD